MTHLTTTNCVRIAVAMALAGRLLGEEDASAPVETPVELRSSVARTPENQNNLNRFLTEFAPRAAAMVKSIRYAREKSDEGKLIENVELLKVLEDNRQLANELLKPPLDFAPDAQLPPQAVPLSVLFQGTEMLARQAMLAHDYKAADLLIEDLLRWSEVLRNARPNFLQLILSRIGWQTAFNTLLWDWARHPDQSVRLDQIQKMYENHPLHREELMESVKAEYRWVISLGGYRKILGNEGYADSVMMFLRPPFDELSREELLKLPYDVEADFRREAADRLEILKCLKDGAPIKAWPEFKPPAIQATLEEYSKRPNGLGDLIYEQTEPWLSSGMWSSGLSRVPLFEACLVWLELERDGKSIDESRFKDFIDPVDGKPLIINLNSRTIRSRGLNLKEDPQDSDGVPMPSAGFCTKGDDLLIVVPRWQSVEKMKNRQGK